jgi:hypothetical protein
LLFNSGRDAQGPRLVAADRQEGAILMDWYEYLSRDSDRHKAKINPDSLEIMPVDSSLEALQRFQPVGPSARI